MPRPILLYGEKATAWPVLRMAAAGATLSELAGVLHALARVRADGTRGAAQAPDPPRTTGADHVVSDVPVACLPVELPPKGHAPRRGS